MTFEIWLLGKEEFSQPNGYHLQAEPPLWKKSKTYKEEKTSIIKDP